MISRISYQKTVAALLVMGAVSFLFLSKSVSAQEPEKRNDRAAQNAPGQRREENKKPPDSTKYSYEFNQPDFYVRHILIEHDATGRGKITFERKNEETPFDEPIELSTGTIGRLLGLWDSLRFLHSTEDYHSPNPFPHLGRMKLRMERYVKKRTAEFNWTNNREASALVTEYRRLADQAILIFDIGIARENQPLNTPKLLEHLETLLNRNELSDPYQLVALLGELTTDDHVPLMARNQATRLLKKIQK